MDRTQLVAICDYMIGGRVVGGSDPGDPVTTEYSPELRAFIQARLGDKTPGAGYAIVPQVNRDRGSMWTGQALALAGLLREVADGLDPGNSLGKVQDRLFDVLLGDDGQAWPEALRYLRDHRPDLADRFTVS